MHAVRGGKEERAIYGGQVIGIRTGGAWIDFLHKHGACLCTVAFPQFTSVSTVVGSKEGFPVDVGQVAWV